MTQEQIIEAERLAEKEKNRERKAVREAKMDEWNNEQEAKKKEGPTKEQIDAARKRIDARVFKIRQTREAKAKSIKEDLREAAQNSSHKRNRSPDDGFQLVGDRRHNICKVADVEQESSSDEEQDLNISEICSIAKKNALDIHKTEERRQKKEQMKASRKEEEELKARKEKKQERKRKQVQEEYQAYDAGDF